MKHGFHIILLRVTGNQKQPAEIRFASGLNVVAGASDTGKSFIFQCLDYMLGAKSTPKEIPEASGYSIFELEIKTLSGETYTLKRNWEAGKFHIKKGGIDSDLPEEEYIERLSDDPKNISTFLLSLCGFENIALKKNSYEKIRLSFRDIGGLTLVDEEQIITEGSPVHSSQESTSKTKEQSLFYYLLTGLDATNFVEGEDPKMFKGKINGKIELIKESIDRTQAKLDNYKNQNIDQLTKLVNENIDALSLEYNTQIVRIDELKSKRNQYHIQKTKRESAVLFKKELVDRFELLKKHYLSDLERLQFISEGNSLVSQLNSVNCPICGTELKEGHLNHLIKFEEDNITLEQASKGEIKKIELKLKELDETLFGLNEEINKVSSTIKRLVTQIASADSELNQNLSPITATLKQRINSLFQEKQRLAEYERLREQITTYQHQINDLNAQLKSRSKQNKQNLSFNRAAIEGFCKIVEQTLGNWKFPNVSTVVFDTKYDVFDIVINGKKRRSNGKGIRAITYAAFILSLMKYVYEKKHPYSCNMVLDSPLTTFKERDRLTQSSKEEIDQETESAFFSDLANLTPDFQIIILDNKEPPTELRDRINYVHFSGEVGVGRAGFFE